MKLINGEVISQNILNDLKNEIKKINATPKLAIIQVDNLIESIIYVERKINVAKTLGVKVKKYQFDKDIAEQELIEKIIKLNNDKSVHGILVQLPLPKQINENLVFQTLSPLKDVDGFTPFNKGLLEINEAELISPTALGAFSILKNYNIDPIGKNIVVIGKGKIAGKPLSTLLSNGGATVTLCDEYTKDVSYFTKNADIIFTAVGKPNLLTHKDIKKGSILINIGIKKINDKVFGDFELDNVKGKALLATPTPGGTGPLTVAYLFLNLLKCYKVNLILNNKKW